MLKLFVKNVTFYQIKQFMLVYFPYNLFDVFSYIQNETYNNKIEIGSDIEIYHKIYGVVLCHIQHLLMSIASGQILQTRKISFYCFQ